MVAQPIFSTPGGEYGKKMEPYRRLGDCIRRKTDSMETKGFIKYQCDWKKANAVPHEAVVDITRYRNALYKLKLIREDADGTGVGNLSIRKVFAMAGHEDGIVAFGEDLETAYRVLIDWGLRTGLFNQAEAQSAIDLPKQMSI